MVIQQPTNNARTNARGRSLRLLFLADQMGYANGTTHGGTTYFLNALPALHRVGIEMTVCFMAPRHPAADRLEERGLKPIFLGRRKWDPRAFVDVVRLVRQRHIDVLHLASLKSMLFGRWIARMTGRRSVIHIHDTSPLPFGMGFIERLTAPLTDAAIVLSAAIQPWTERQFAVPAQRITVVPNGMDLRPFLQVTDRDRREIRRELNIDDTSRLIVVAGRIVPDKGQDRLIRAMPALLKRVPSAMLCLVGEGHGRVACARMAAELTVADRVRFTGYRTDIPRLLCAADVVAVPSLHESFGYSALEAMAAGRPVVAFRVGGLPELIEESTTGLLVAVDDETGLMDALHRLLSDATLAARMGRAGRRRATQFTIERHVDQLLHVYKNLYARNHSRIWHHPTQLAPSDAKKRDHLVQTAHL